MGFDLKALAAALASGPVIRVVIAQTRGSVPREVGAAMLIDAAGQSGTIGGGALEYEATARARRMLNDGAARAVWVMPLGPGLGQCCGGAVTLLAERYETLPDAALFPRAVPITSDQTAPPPAIDAATVATFRDGWFIEPLSHASEALWIWGAGHVGRALVDVFAPMPDIALTWLDTAPARFPDLVPDHVTQLPAPDLPRAMVRAPQDAHHLILTYSHDIDLALCHAALSHGFGSCGLIGSATKWARFRSRLRDLGHTDAQISGIACPIGDPELGKHPQEIAISAAARHLGMRGKRGPSMPVQGARDDRPS